MLVKDVPLSKDKHLVLDLVGPTGTSGRGVAFHLTLKDTTIAGWSKVETGDPEYAQTDAFPSPASGVTCLKTHLDGADLQVGAFQKGTGSAAVAFGPNVVFGQSCTGPERWRDSGISCGCCAWGKELDDP